jgi:hypothetical protein
MTTLILEDIEKHGKHAVLVLRMSYGYSVPERMLDKLFEIAQRAGAESVSFKVKNYVSLNERVATQNDNQGTI